MINLANSFSHYAGRTADKIGIPKDETLARACVELMFEVMLEHAVAVKKTPLEQYTYAEHQTSRWVGPRYESFVKYTPDFLKDEAPANRDAVLVAMLCPGYTHMADTFADGNDDPDKPTVFKHDVITSELVVRVEEMIDEAESLLNKILGTSQNFDEQREPGLGSVFLAHGYLGDFLMENSRRGYDDYDAEQNREIRENVFSPARAFVHTYTRLGRDLIEHIDLSEAILDLVHPPAPPEPTVRQRPFLALVQNSQPIP